MRQRFKWNPSPIREWLCHAPKCKAKTKDWLAEGWFVTGFTTEKYFTHRNSPDQLSIEDKTFPRETYAETDFARDELVKTGKLAASAWACSYVCPEHKDAVLRDLEA